MWDINKILMLSEATQDPVNYLSALAEEISVDRNVGKLNGWIIRGVEVLKVGTWKGREYTEDDLKEMVDNFKALKNSDTFSPTLKKNHSEDVDDQIGWIYDLRVDGELLLADFHITEWMAIDKIENGTWRFVSAEIYPPDLAKEVFPDAEIEGSVLRAVAIVSTPAVKGLKGIILNSERWEEIEGGNHFMNKYLEMLSELGIEVTDEQKKKFKDKDEKEQLVLFGEIVKEHKKKDDESSEDEKDKKPDQLSEGDEPSSKKEKTPAASGGVVQFSAEEFVNLSKKFSEHEGQIEDLTTQLGEMKKESRKAGIAKRVDSLLRQGKITPAEKDGIVAFAEKLKDDDALSDYFKTLEKRSKVVEFDESGTQDQEDDESENDIALFHEQFDQKTYK